MFSPSTPTFLVRTLTLLQLTAADGGSTIESTRSAVIRMKNKYKGAHHKNDLHLASDTNANVTTQATYANGSSHLQTTSLKEARKRHTGGGDSSY